MSRRTLSILFLILCGVSARTDDTPTTAKEPELRTELLRRMKVDQDARNALVDWIKKHGDGGSVNSHNLSAELKKEFERLLGAVSKADKENMERLSQIIDKHGWPTITLVGKDGSNAACMLVQQADAEAKFQRKCLDLMAKLPKNEISQSNLAHLTDRVLLAEGKKQVYGTQFTSENGKWEPRPLEDPENVDKRRAEVGLKPLAEHVKDLESDYGTPRAAKEPELRTELLRRMKVDQDARNAWISWMKEHGEGGSVNLEKLSAELKAEYNKLHDALTKTDKENTERLGQIIDKHGWPTITLVGKDGSNAAWLLVQHADADAKFQRKCLDLMAKLPKNEISQSNLAYLTDRVLLAEGKKQVYGTQFTSENGKWEPRPLEDPDNVDKRRAEVGLKPLADYVKELESVYGVPKKK